jgi:hypothetical protein
MLNFAGSNPLAFMACFMRWNSESITWKYLQEKKKSCTNLDGTLKCAKACANENMVDVESRARFTRIIALHLRLIDRASFRPSDVIITGPTCMALLPGVDQGSINHNMAIKKLTISSRRDTSLKGSCAITTASKPPKRANIWPSKLFSPTVTKAYPKARTIFIRGSAA